VPVVAVWLILFVLASIFGSSSQPTITVDIANPLFVFDTATTHWHIACI